MSQTLLVADDSQTIRRVVEMALKGSTWEVTGVDSARDAMEAARQSPQVILLDYYMPDGSGYDVCRALKNNDATSTIPVIMLGGSFKAFDEDLARQSGADGIVMKPFKTDTLLSAIESVANGVPVGGAAAAEPGPPAPPPVPEAQPMAEPEPAHDAAPMTQEVPMAADSEPMLVLDSESEVEPAVTAESQPRIPSEPAAGGSQSRISTPDVNASSREAASQAPPPATSSGSGLASLGMNRADFENMVREEVKGAVRSELPGLLRNIMGEIFQQKVLPKVVEHTEARVKQLVSVQLSEQIRENVRVELERLLSEE